MEQRNNALVRTDGSCVCAAMIRTLRYLLQQYEYYCCVPGTAVLRRRVCTSAPYTLLLVEKHKLKHDTTYCTRTSIIQPANMIQRYFTCQRYYCCTAPGIIPMLLYHTW